MSRPTRVLYVENDPALLGVVSMLLRGHSGIELTAAVTSADAALAVPELPQVDVALLDVALGASSITGVELGILLRERFPNMGVVLFSQHVVPDFLDSLPEDYRWGWSFLEKRSDVDIDFLVEVLRSTARGLNVVDPSVTRARARVVDSPISRLTARQREILALAATGLDAPAIGKALSLAAVTVRQELSRAYSVLVPDPKPGTDLRTSAVLRYMREMRTYEDNRS